MELVIFLNLSINNTSMISFTTSSIKFNVLLEKFKALSNITSMLSPHFSVPFCLPLMHIELRKVLLHTFGEKNDEKNCLIHATYTC